MKKLYATKALLKKDPTPDPLSYSWSRDCSTAQTTGTCCCSAAAFLLKSLGTPFMMQ